MQVVVNVLDLGYLGVGTDSPEQPYPHYHIKRRETVICHKKKKKSITEFIPKKGE